MMDVDIDIEEHDLLDNPIIKSIFPDISIVKKEIESYYNAGTVNSAVEIDTHVSSTSTYAQDPTIDSTTLISEIAKSLNPIQDDMGSIKIKKNVTAISDHIGHFKNNKIIFGTKPAKSVINQEQLPLIEAKLLLYNIYSYLENSGRFCYQCLILFPDEIAFDSHRDSVHTKAWNQINSGCINIKDSHQCYICFKKFNYSDLQCHLRQVHQIKSDTHEKIKKTWNSQTETALLQKKSSININLKKKFGEQTKTLKSENVFKDSKERVKIDSSITKKNKQTVFNKKNYYTNTSNIESENVSNSGGTQVQDTETDSSGAYTCFHCDMLFVTQKDVIEHLYTIMQVKNINSEVCEKKISDHKSSKTDINTPNKRVIECGTKIVNYIKNGNAEQRIDTNTKNTNNLTNVNPSKYEFDTNMYFKCDVCSYYFNSTNLCSRHLLMKHGINNEKYKKGPFVPDCVFCLKNIPNVDEYNTHITDIHQIKYTENLLDTEQISESEQATNSESGLVSFALKSTLFKCTQCDIHFLSAKAAQSHAEHMELLINWKCNKCYRIFKKNDESLHVKQHTFSNTFIVHDLSASALFSVLYNCSKCAIHFTEEQFLNHYPICETETPISTYCKICDILIDEGTFKTHAMMHNKKEPLNFITIDTDVISIKRHCQREKIPCAQKRKSIENAETSMKKKKHDMDNRFHLFYCDTCNSFLNKQDYHIHMRAQCVLYKKKICKICGLVFTNRNYSLHKDLHCKLGFLKVQDFTFCELKTKKQICPPMPEYPRCNYCNVIFILQLALLSHECHDENYLTCHICDDKLSDDAFKLHMSFHNYSISNILKDDQQEIDSLIKEKNSTNPSYLKEQTDGLQSKSDMISSSLVKSSQTPSPLASFKSGSKTFNKTYSNLSKPTNINGNTDVCVSKLRNSSITKSAQNNSSTTTKIKRKKTNTELYLAPIIYSCKNCSIAVDTYDKVVEHSQSHYEDEEVKINTEDYMYCHECDLKFAKSCYGSHEKLHHDKTSFKILNFDTYYFTFDNNIWLKHVFGPMPQSLIDLIVNKSIYRSECRVKMELVQEGPPHLTVFQCDKCQCFIDPLAIYKHAENSCFKLRYHPCSFCGLPFISSNTQIAHEKIHETANITVKSYRIVAFNKNEDRKFNNVLYNRTLHTLYQCRNCDVATVKSKIMNHKCDVYNLKKCLECGLLLCGPDFETHILQHKEITNFIPNNMKVVMFGDRTENTECNANKLKSTYSGVICDYLYYRCSKCQVCMKKKYLPGHVCSFGISRSQCPECKLYFLNTKFKHHRKLHEDPDFNAENVKVVTCDPSLHKESEHFDSSTTSNKILKYQNNVISPNELIWKVAKIYKCTCGLNFLDAISVSTHIKSCNPKIRTSKQKCSKCDLLFTPNILFSHLLKHHGNKKYKYTFEIIDMTCDINLTNILYRCPKCKLHFVKGKEASTHLLDCKGRNSEGKLCNYCNLLFNEICYNIHLENHCNTEFGNNIIEIKKCSIPLVKIDDVHNKEKDNELTEKIVDDSLNKIN